MTRAVAYARVSSDGQAEKNTIENQLVAIREWAESRDIELVEEFLDEGVSGAIQFHERPEAQRLLDSLDSIDTVIVYCPDRLGRDTQYALEAMREFKRRKVAVDFATQSFDDTIEGQLGFQVLLAIAEYEKGSIARRTMNGRYRSVRGGKYLASVVPFGYVRQEDGTLGVDEVEAEVVRRIFMWAQTDGLHVIAARLEETGAAPRTMKSKHYGCAKGCAAVHYKTVAWHSSYLSRILNDERYIGRNTYAGIEMPCPSIVGEDLFYAVAEARKGRAKFGTTGAPRTDLLRGVVKCRRCEANAIGRTDVLRDGTRIDVYECGRRRRTPGQHEKAQRRFRTLAVDAAVHRYIVEELLVDPEAALARARVTAAQSAKARVETAAERERARKELAGLDTEASRAKTMAVKGLLTDDECEGQLARIDGRRSELEAILAEVADVTPLALVVGDAVATRPKDMDALVAELRRRGLEVREISERAATPEEALEITRGLVRDYVRTVWLEDDGRISVEGSLPSANSSPRS